MIVAVDGKPTDTTRELIDIISSYPPDTKVRLEIVRDGKKLTVPVILEERPGEEGEETDVAGEEGKGNVAERVGITVTEITPRLRQMLGLDDDVQGVVVTHVDPMSPAGEEGVMRGDVITEANGRTVTSVESLMAQVKKVKKNGYLRLYVYRPRADRSFFVILKLAG